MDDSIVGEARDTCEARLTHENQHSIYAASPLNIREMFFVDSCFSNGHETENKISSDLVTVQYDSDESRLVTRWSPMIVRGILQQAFG